jgi:hypothetical protein
MFRFRRNGTCSSIGQAACRNQSLRTGRRRGSRPAHSCASVASGTQLPVRPEMLDYGGDAIRRGSSPCRPHRRPTSSPVSRSTYRGYDRAAYAEPFGQWHRQACRMSASPPRAQVLALSRHVAAVPGAEHFDRCRPREWRTFSTPAAAAQNCSARDLARGRGTSHRFVTTTSRYSLGTTMVPSSALFMREMRACRSSVRPRCLASSSAANALSIGP